MLTRWPSFFTSLYTGSDPATVRDTLYASSFGFGSSIGVVESKVEADDVEASDRRRGAASVVGTRRIAVSIISMNLANGKIENAF